MMDEEAAQEAARWHRKGLRLEDHDYSEEGYVYFVTLSAHHLTAPFSPPRLASAIVDALDYQRKLGRARVYAYCLMPDHLHIALSPVGGCSIPQVLQSFKSYTTKLAWQQGIPGRLWHRSYYDHVARRDEDLLAVCDYILANPVRKGLASEAADWPYSGMPDTLAVLPDIVLAGGLRP